MKCSRAMHSKKMAGRGNRNYVHGQSYAKEYHDARPLVMERDGRRCVVCGQTEIIGKDRSNLLVHHRNENIRDNRLENLVTACGTCHAVHHKSDVTPYPQLSA
jgi:5-methylcytosine-specific restriction endonuclease McrA